MAKKNERLKEEPRNQLEEVAIMKRQVELKDTKLCDTQAVLEQDKNLSPRTEMYSGASAVGSESTKVSTHRIEDCKVN